jgi:predicted secreted protein
MSRRNSVAWCIGLLLIAGAVVMALCVKVPPKDDLGAKRFAAGSDTSGAQAQDIESSNHPVVVGFVGDLAVKGTKRNDGSVIPFVIGDALTLEAEALNATEYRWTLNGEVLKEKGQEWSVRKDREYEVVAAGELRFSVQVRGADPAAVSQPKETTLKTEPLYIESFEKSIVHDGDRSLTGEEFTVEVQMAEPIAADLDFYKFRYSVNDVPQKHPEDEQEWTSETDFTYKFPTPGQYSFKVEVRRATEKAAEKVAVLAEIITVADAVLLSFDAYPEKVAALGATVNLDVFPESLFGMSECRFGVKKMGAADFEWVLEEDGASWGAAERDWLPKEPGNYIVRAEVREAGKEEADDFREMLYTVMAGEF